MTPETFTQQWAQIRQHLRGWWDRLTEQDLDHIAGQQDQLVRVIQERYQLLRERAQGEIDQRLQAYQTAGGSMAEAMAACGSRRGQLYTRPAVPPIFGAAITAETAPWVGSWADRLLTVGGTPEAVRQRLEAFAKGEGAGKPVSLQVALSYARGRGAPGGV